MMLRCRLKTIDFFLQQDHITDMGKTAAERQRERRARLREKYYTNATEFRDVRTVHRTANEPEGTSRSQ